MNGTPVKVVKVPKPIRNNEPKRIPVQGWPTTKTVKKPVTVSK